MEVSGPRYIIQGILKILTALGRPVVPEVCNTRAMSLLVEDSLVSAMEDLRDFSSVQ